MRISFPDDNDNYLLWGQLVETWIRDRTTRPASVPDLLTQMEAKGITFPVVPKGYDSLEFYDYLDSGTLVIPLPSVTMLDARLAAAAGGPYPFSLMPHFTDVAFGGSVRANLVARRKSRFRDPADRGIYHQRMLLTFRRPPRHHA